jgi:L-methionine (R)-S-oxide reductase
MESSYGMTTYHVYNSLLQATITMSEVTLDLRALPKPQAYTELSAHIDAVLFGIDDEITAMATISALLHHAFGFLWTGFYRVVGSGFLLRVGPYQGTLGCLEIPIGQGVCGTAAANRRTLIVDDVEQFSGHIACDARSKSEIVVPVFNAIGALIAVLDVDADRPAMFDEADQAGLERIVSHFTRSPATR